MKQEGKKARLTFKFYNSLLIIYSIILREESGFLKRNQTPANFSLNYFKSNLLIILLFGESEQNTFENTL